MYDQNIHILKFKENIKDLQAVLKAKERMLESNPDVLREMLVKTENELAEEKAKSVIKQNTHTQNRALIEKNRALLCELEEMHGDAAELPLDRVGVCPAGEVGKYPPGNIQLGPGGDQGNTEDTQHQHLHLHPGATARQ